MSLKPAGLDTGDRFRLMFITDGEIRANTVGFENYDGHARNAIAGGHTDIRKFARRLRAVVSTSDTGSREFANENGVTTPSVETGVRHDAGDADTGTGIELGGSIRYAGSGFSIEAAARGLVAHDQTGYEEWGASGTVSIDAGVSQRGLSLRIAPA